ncbi:MAG TPA: glycoside hydrolase family 3 N-terminal domain-containing protein, partial [Tichowtungia sp.]|nr:glycoside hydrolase family 3 N-terminal domain-containing protein [Tichowtungia sp.]
PTARFKGLTMWSPTVNLARDPRWGRNEETYGEDPWLTSRIAIGFVKGLQGTNPKYLKTVATVKHFIANNHENDRTRDRYDVPEQFLRDYYMIPYKAAIEEGDVRSIMSAYNGINDIPCTMNKWLLTDVLRNEWGFDGTVVTDVSAPEWLTTRHGTTASHEEGSAAMLEAGVDVICGLRNFSGAVKQAIEDDLVSEEQLDQAVTQNLSTRMEFGQVIDDSDNPYKNIPISIVGSPEHRAIARKIAQQGTVLLKNENHMLPINTEKIKRIIVAGPYGNAAPLGGYFGTPTITPISPLTGLSSVASEKGMEVIHINSGEDYTPVLSSNLRPAAGVEGEIGLKGEYFKGTELRGSPSATRLDQAIDFTWPKPIENIDPLIPQPKFSVRWTGQLVPDRTGEYQLAVDSDDGVRVWLNGELIIEDWTARAVKRNESKPVMLTAGEPCDLRVEYFDAGWDATVN